MPGSGKSTVGVILAKQTGRDFIDTDVLIQSEEGRTLQDIVDQDGYLALRRIEESLLINLSVRHHVIATGGSAVYSPAAMRHLRSDGIAVLLHANLATLQQRVQDYATRGLAKAPDQTLDDLFAERLPLYQAYADVLVWCDDLNHEQVATRIVCQLDHWLGRSG